MEITFADASPFRGGFQSNARNVYWWCPLPWIKCGCQNKSVADQMNIFHLGCFFFPLLCLVSEILADISHPYYYLYFLLAWVYPHKNRNDHFESYNLSCFASLPHLTEMLPPNTKRWSHWRLSLNVCGQKKSLDETNSDASRQGGKKKIILQNREHCDFVTFIYSICTGQHQRTAGDPTRSPVGPRASGPPLMSHPAFFQHYSDFARSASCFSQQSRKPRLFEGSRRHRW